VGARRAGGTGGVRSRWARTDRHNADGRMLCARPARAPSQPCWRAMMEANRAAGVQRCTRQQLLDRGCGGDKRPLNELDSCYVAHWALALRLLLADFAHGCVRSSGACRTGGAKRW
jgi:hypothetical protein